MNSEFNKELKKYFKEIKKKLNCKSYLKQGFIAQFKESLNEFIENHNNEELTIENIYKHFGTPDAIAKSFDDFDDISELKEKSKKYLITQIISCILSVIMLTVIIVLLFVVFDLFDNGQREIIINNKF